ncbi:MAG: threonine-phosphate decarboxylase [Cellvibrionales bacterium]|mgnify:CR=1 FL=1|jgi:cobalamin biosynthetic protein CobC|nr:threonine-phosphate decarboxylase [Cellvibrionales bacterium]MBK8674974.1 threonine-phosphate decarboxylase [Cellvibrionales bacterium]HRF87568.1 threonine-phosphate decarboxylase CobD [Pseudomonadales bacterium]HRG49515.1 threonine-phosphate decarboxylase CobD [Pseudomonadales bacterium]
MLEHGGKLRAAVQQYHIPLEDWLDLSAALNPTPYPVGKIHYSTWQRLPEDDDALITIAARYYGNEQLLPVAGSQAAIQTLPFLFSAPLRVGILQTTYNEHAHAWRRAGHTLIALDEQEIDQHISQLDVLLLVNPNNPTSAIFSRAQLRQWHAQLTTNKGWLIVDEAFIDCDPQHSLVQEAQQTGLIILRSLGKFFGLAGARVGFVFAEKNLLANLRETLGPWPISHPSRIAAQRALSDSTWQQQQREMLPQQSARLAQLLTENGLAPTGGCALFQWIQTPTAAAIHHHLATQGILTRLYAAPASLRLGLPAEEAEWERLTSALKRALINHHI